MPAHLLGRTVLMPLGILTGKRLPTTVKPITLEDPSRQLQRKTRLAFAKLRAAAPAQPCADAFAQDFRGVPDGDHDRLFQVSQQRQRGIC